jgi:hypothetical protein
MRKALTATVSLCLLATLFTHYAGVSASASENEIHHQGGLIIEGGITHVIENTTIYVDGNIFVKDKSTLIIRNSTVILELNFFGEHWVEVSDQSKLLVDNSTLERTNQHVTIFLIRPGCEATINNTRCGWDLNQGGKVVLKNYDASAASNGIIFNEGQIEALDSNFNIIAVPVRGREKDTVELDGLNPGHIDNVMIQKEGGKDYLKLTNSIVERWVVDVGEAQYPSLVDVVIRNSRLSGLWIWFFPGSDAEIRDVTVGIYPFWKMSDAWSLDNVGYDVTLENTYVEWFKLQIVGNARIENASGIQVATRGSSLVHVKDSIIQWDLILRGNEHVILEDTEIQGTTFQMLEDRSDLQYTIGKGGTHHLEFRQATVKVPIHIAAEYTKMEGEVTFLTSLQKVNWAFGKVEREYPVVVLDHGNNPLPGMPMQLLDFYNDSVWYGTTDGNGKLFPMITFDENNYTQEWTLVSLDGGFSKTLDLLTSTPVLIYPAAGDLRETETKVKEHKGDLIIHGDQTYVIENETFVIDGNIIVKDEAKLVVENSSIFLKATYTNQYEIAVLNRAMLEINNSTLDYPDRERDEIILVIRMEHPDTMLSIRNSTIHLGVLLSSFAVIESSEIYGDGVLWRSYGPSQLEMKDSTTRFITLSLMGNEPEEVMLSGLKFPAADDVHITTTSGARVDIGNCYLEQGWIVDAAEYDRDAYSVHGMRNRLHLIVEDSDIERLWFWFGSDAYVKVDNLHPMEVTQWNMQDTISGSGFEYDVTVRNSSVKWYQLTFRGNAEVDNISGTEVTLQEQASVSISNSRLEQYVNLTGTNDHLEIINSVITTKGANLIFREGLGPWEPPPGGYNHHVEFHNTTMDARINVECQYTTIKGEVEFNSKLDRVKWSFGNVGREYPVAVVDKDKSPLPDVSLQLFDSDKKLVWTGRTDENGRAFPVISFNKDNYTDEWQLVVVGTGISKVIGLLTNTPVIISLARDEIETEAKPPKATTTMPEGISWWQVVLSIVTGAVIVGLVAYLFIGRRRRA